MPLYSTSAISPALSLPRFPEEHLDGYDDASATNLTNWLYSSRQFSLPAGTVSAIWIKFGDVAAGVGNVRLALYNGTTLVVETASTANAKRGWQKIAVSDTTVSAAATYRCCLLTDNNAISIRRQTIGGSGQGYAIATAYGAFPASIAGGGAVDEDYNMQVEMKHTH